MKDIEILLELYKEQRGLGIHHEEQRSTVTGLMLTIATILIGVIALDNKLNWSDLPLALVVVVLGVFGALFVLKDYERFTFHRNRSRLLRKAIDAALRWGELNNAENQGVRDEIRSTFELKPEDSPYLLQSLVTAANAQYKSKRRFLVNADLHKFWAALHIIIAIIGLLILLVIITGGA